MTSSPTITKIAPALLKAQQSMSNPKKGASNPFFKSKYADLNAVREACIPALNEHGITVLQPTIVADGKNYINTILLHESGEWMSSVTEVIASKPNDAQSHGSGMSYARRYGLQSFCALGADDDDGNKAVEKQDVKPYVNQITQCKSIADLKKLKETTPASVQSHSEWILMAKLTYEKLNK